MLYCTSVLLLFIPHAKWYNTHRSRDSKHSIAPYGTLIEHVDNVLGISRKVQIENFFKNSLDSYFKLKSDTFPKSARLENQESKPWGKTLENLIFCMILTNLTKTGGGRVSYFTLYWNFTNKFLEH